MRSFITSQQTAFFTQNGYIELGGLNFNPEELFSNARGSIQPFGRDLWRSSPVLRRLLLSKLGPAVFQLSLKPLRLAFDQWIPAVRGRQQSLNPSSSEPFRDLSLAASAPMEPSAYATSHPSETSSKSLVESDELILYRHPLKIDKPCPIQDLFCIQGLALCALFTGAEVSPPVRRAAALGIPPFSSSPDAVLFVRPNIVLDWPLLLKSPVDLYVAAYALTNHGVYVHNPKDAATHSLKDLGYEFGDVLTEAHHPTLLSK